MGRIVNNVVDQIMEILVNFCNDEETINKWKIEFEWFVEMDTYSNSRYWRTKYWNLAPEYIELLKWEQLSNIINAFILFEGDHNEWEKKIINVFLNNDNTDAITYPYIDEYGREWVSHDTTMEQHNRRKYIEYYAERDEYKEDLELADEERAASKHSRL
jgi:hypothetical protein